MGIILKQEGKIDEAIIKWEKVIQVNPDYQNIYKKLSVSCLQIGKFDKAIIYFATALQNDPDWINGINNLAWLLATYRDSEFHDPEEAIQLSERVCKLTNNENPEFLDTLAAAYASAGRFSDAVITSEKAIELAISLDLHELEKEIRQRLELYKRDQAYITSVHAVIHDNNTATNK